MTEAIPPDPQPASPEAPRGFPSAARTFVGWQKAALLIAPALLVAALVSAWKPTLLALNIAFTLFYVATTLYRMLIIRRALSHHCDIEIPPEQLRQEPPGGWPRYTIQIPLYKEAAILPHLVESLCRLDYPTDKLEIRLLIEADDDATMGAARAIALPAHFVIWPIPVSQPRTKPKACNVGLENTTGDFLVIFDAEDRPEPDQLKKAAWAFASLPPSVACIQGKLNFYNSRSNLLARCFTMDYTTWFDLCLPGLDSLGAPIPLGGTSNHFRLSVLKELGGWDEYNVTEDCDLGMRLYLRGYQTHVLASTTWEQACNRPAAWVRQRSRWVKGYVQTYLVHTRKPLRLFQQLGVSKALQFHLLVGGSVLAQLLNPLYWALAVLWFFVRSEQLQAFFPPPVFIAGAFCLFIGNFAFMYAAALGCVKRGLGDTAKFALFMPAYWMLMSLGAWKGFLQLIYAPHFWEKTQHHEIPAIPGTQGPAA